MYGFANYFRLLIDYGLKSYIRKMIMVDTEHHSQNGYTSM